MKSKVSNEGLMSKQTSIAAMMLVMLVTLLIGFLMNSILCLISCLTAAPLTYWLLCYYKKFKAERLWVLIFSMPVFYCAQFVGGTGRISLLILSFGLVTYVGSILYRNLKSYLLTSLLVLYLGILLPTFAIGYNQYACINYGRSCFRLFSSFEGVIYLTDGTRELYGLRDRFGLLTEPEYERISESDISSDESLKILELRKDGYIRYYDVNNKSFTHDFSIRPDLQHKVRMILESYLTENASEYNDRGQIGVIDLTEDKHIADVRITMLGNPVLNYEPDSFLTNHTSTFAAEKFYQEVNTGLFYQRESIRVQNTTKHSLSYLVNVPGKSFPRYRIFIMLATDSVPDEKAICKLAEKVALLPELNLYQE